jgi:prepilin-type processing-associated H-X9-DG protein
LHSWRTLILPYIEQQALYKQIDLSKPWDDQANKIARETRIPLYQCPSSTVLSGQTTYFAVVAPGACFQPSGPTPLSAITDSPSNTLLVIEVADEYAVPWMSPTDASEVMILSRSAEHDYAHSKGTNVVFVDGHTQFLPADLPPATLRALISITGNDDAHADF